MDAIFSSSKRRSPEHSPLPTRSVRSRLDMALDGHVFSIVPVHTAPPVTRSTTTLLEDADDHIPSRPSLDSCDVPVGLSFLESESGHASPPPSSSRLPPPPLNPPSSISRPTLPPIQSLFPQLALNHDYEERAQARAQPENVHVQPTGSSSNTFHANLNTTATGPARAQESIAAPSGGAKYKTRRSDRHKILSDFLGFVPTDCDELSHHEKKKYWIKALEGYVEHVEGVALSQGIRLPDMHSTSVDSYDMRDDETTKAVLAHAEHNLRATHRSVREEEQKFLKLRAQLMELSGSQ